MQGGVADPAFGTRNPTEGGVSDP
ncbi:MAG: hypothetical protein RIS54_1887, partial [Verrucomicrobiota bacterium]